MFGSRSLSELRMGSTRLFDVTDDRRQSRISVGRNVGRSDVRLFQKKFRILQTRGQPILIKSVSILKIQLRDLKPKYSLLAPLHVQQNWKTNQKLGSFFRYDFISIRAINLSRKWKNWRTVQFCFHFHVGSSFDGGPHFGWRKIKRFRVYWSLDARSNLISGFFCLIVISNNSNNLK